MTTENRKKKKKKKKAKKKKDKRGRRKNKEIKSKAKNNKVQDFDQPALCNLSKAKILIEKIISFRAELRAGLREIFRQLDQGRNVAIAGIEDKFFKNALQALFVALGLQQQQLGDGSSGYFYDIGTDDVGLSQMLFPNDSESPTESETEAEAATTTVGPTMPPPGPTMPPPGPTMPPPGPTMPPPGPTMPPPGPTMPPPGPTMPPPGPTMPPPGPTMPPPGPTMPPPGPTMPPPVSLQKSEGEQKKKRVIGMTRPPPGWTPAPESDDDEIGPCLPSKAKKDPAAMRASRELEQKQWQALRAGRSLADAEKEEDDGKDKRQDWMMTMPENMPINGAVSANLNARVFKSRTTLDVDEESWNLTPEQRAERQRIKDIKMLTGVDITPKGKRVSNAKDPRAAAIAAQNLAEQQEIAEFNRRSRPKSLLEQHQDMMVAKNSPAPSEGARDKHKHAKKKTKKKKRKKRKRDKDSPPPPQVPARRARMLGAWDRDRDMSRAPKKMSVHASADMIRTATELSSRFSIGSSR